MTTQSSSGNNFIQKILTVLTLTFSLTAFFGCAEAVYFSEIEYSYATREAHFISKKDENSGLRAEKILYFDDEIMVAHKQGDASILSVKSKDKLCEFDALNAELLAGNKYAVIFDGRQVVIINIGDCVIVSSINWTYNLTDIVTNTTIPGFILFGMGSPIAIFELCTRDACANLLSDAIEITLPRDVQNVDWQGRRRRALAVSSESVLYELKWEFDTADLDIELQEVVDWRPDFDVENFRSFALTSEGVVAGVLMLVDGIQAGASYVIEKLRGAPRWDSVKVIEHPFLLNTLAVLYGEGPYYISLFHLPQNRRLDVSSNDVAASAVKMKVVKNFGFSLRPTMVQWTTDGGAIVVGFSKSNCSSQAGMSKEKIPKEDSTCFIVIPYGSADLISMTFDVLIVNDLGWGDGRGRCFQISTMDIICTDVLRTFFIQDFGPHIKLVNGVISEGL